MKKINSIIYGVFGVGTILYGAVALLFPARLLSDASRSTHIMRESGAAMIFVGLMALWCIFNYGRRTSVHYCLMFFALLIWGIHFYDYMAGHLPWMSAAYNGVPFVVLLLMTVFDRKGIAQG